MTYNTSRKQNRTRHRTRRVKHKSAILLKMDSRRTRNTKGVSCGAKNGTTCCPYYNVDEKGRYAATTAGHEFYYKDSKYTVHTCCKMCVDAMQKLANKDIKKFDKLFVSKFFNLGKGYSNQIILKNQHTGKDVQIAREIKPEIPKGKWRRVIKTRHNKTKKRRS